jgi:predicted MFS family arabinose efflux permease
MLCLSQASNFYLLLFFTFIMGGAAAGVHISMTSIAMAWFVKKHLGRAVGVVTGGTGLGILVTGLFLPPILVSLGQEAWRSCWIFMAGITFLVFVLCFFFLKERPAQGFPSTLEGAAGRAPVAMEKEKEGISLRRIFIVYFIFGFSYNIFATYFVAFMKEGVGLSERVAGNIWAIFGWTGMLSGLVWGFLSDRMGRRKALVWNIGVISFAVLLPLLFQQPFLLGTSTFFFGFTFLGAVTIVAAFIGDRAGDRRASVYGILTLVHGVGQLLGTISGGYMRDWTRSFHALLLSSLVGLLLCLVLVVFNKK